VCVCVVCVNMCVCMCVCMCVYVFVYMHLLVQNTGVAAAHTKHYHPHTQVTTPIPCTFASSIMCPLTKVVGYKGQAEVRFVSRARQGQQISVAADNLRECV